jgi:hypothetical protein
MNRKPTIIMLFSIFLFFIVLGMLFKGNVVEGATTQGASASNSTWKSVPPTSITNRIILSNVPVENKNKNKGKNLPHEYVTIAPTSYMGHNFKNNTKVEDIAGKIGSSSYEIVQKSPQYHIANFYSNKPKRDIVAMLRKEVAKATKPSTANVANVIAQKK